MLSLPMLPTGVAVYYLVIPDATMAKASHVPVKSLVEELTNPNHGAGRPVFDKTGVTGQGTPSAHRYPDVAIQ